MTFVKTPILRIFGNSDRIAENPWHRKRLMTIVSETEFLKNVDLYEAKVIYEAMQTTYDEGNDL